MENRKLIKPVLWSLLFGFVIASIAQSCKTNKSAASNKFKPIYGAVAQPTAPAYADTPYRPRPLTPKQLKDYLLPYYRASFEEWFIPEYKRLNRVIDDLTEANKKLSESNLILAKNNELIINRSRKKRDSLENVARFFKDQAIALQKKSEIDTKRSLANQDETIKGINNVISFISGLGVFFGIGVIIIIFIGHHYIKRVKNVETELAYFKRNVNQTK